MKTGLLLCLPELGGRLVVEEELTRESRAELCDAGYLSLPADEAETLCKLNEQYRAKFLFPFVICVRENKRQAVLDSLRSRVNNSSERELEVSIAELLKIARLRLADAFNSLFATVA